MDIPSTLPKLNPTRAFDVLPPGKYLAQIVSSEMRPTKDGMGQYLFLEIDILEGQYAGRKLFDRLNLVNPSANAVEIARRTLSALCRAVGKMQVNNSEQLHLLPFIADVRVRPPQGQYGESNSLRYLPRSGAPSVATPPRLTPAPTPTVVPTPTPAANGLPWQRQA